MLLFFAYEICKSKLPYLFINWIELQCFIRRGSSQLLMFIFISEKQLDKIKEDWIIFKFYLMDLIVPRSKLTGPSFAALYDRFTPSSPEDKKRNHKMFTDFVKNIQRVPGILQNVSHTQKSSSRAIL